MIKTILEGRVKATANEKDPLLADLTFVFTDFLPNKNKQGVPRTEADNIIRTGVNKPVKVDFRRGKVNDHAYSVPIGPITSLELQDDVIIGRAVVWKDEFGDLTQHLEKASASDEGVQFSWELYHDSKSIDDAGVAWLNNCVVAGATIVANPAYAGRTPLLAFAAEDMTEKVNDLERQVAELQKQLSHDRSNESMDPMDELKQLVAGLGERLTAIEEAVTKSPEAEQASDDTAVSPDVEALTAELAELRTFKETVETEKARAALLVARRDTMKDTMPADEFTAKADFIAGLSDEQFKTFSESLAAVAAKAKVTASDRSARYPMPEPAVSSEHKSGVSPVDLGKALREHKK